MDKPSIIAGRDGNAGGDYLIGRGSLESPSEYNGRARWTAGAGSATCMERAAVKAGKVPWDAEALPHSEGVEYKVKTKSRCACGTGGWGHSKRRWAETT
jgi:hypothetical protein